MRQSFPLALVAAIVGLAVLLLLPGDDPAPDGVLPDTAPPPQAPADLEDPEVPGGERAPDEPSTSARAPVAAADDAPVAAEHQSGEPEGRARLVGRFLLPSGAPAAGVHVELGGFQANSERVRRHGLPEDWVEPTTTSGDDGSFELRFDPPRAFQFFLDARLAGHAEESWRWGELSVTEDRDLGDVTLRAAGELEVRIVDASGTPSPQGWVIHVKAPAGAGGGAGRDDTRVSAKLDEAEELFRATGLPAGPVEVKAYHSLVGWLESPPAEVALDRTNRVELTYDGPDLSRRIEVNTYVRPYHILEGRDEVVRLEGQGIVRETGVVPGTSSRFVFDDLPPGPYTLSIDQGQFEPWSQEGVEPGSAIGAQLVPSGRLVLELTDAATGEAVPEATLSLRLDFRRSTFPNTFLIHTGALPEGGLLPPVPPGNTTLIVQAPGYAELELDVDDLAPFETRAVAAALSKGTAISGVVRTHAGVPIPGAEVLLMPPGAPPAVSILDPTEPGYVGALQTTDTDADGRFRFDRLVPGPYDVHAAGTPWLLASAVGLVLGPGQERELDLRIPAGAGLDVTIGGVAELPADFEVVLVTELERVVDQGSFLGKTLDTLGGRTRLTRTGASAWSGRDLPPGPGHVLVGRGETKVRDGNRTTFYRGRKLRLEDVQLETGGVTSLVTELGDMVPGEVRVEVLADGLPEPGARVILRGDDGFGGAALTDPDGFALVDGVFPGEVRVTVAREGFGRFDASGSVTVETGRRTEVRVDTTAVAGRLRLLDPTGAPHRRKSVQLEGGGLSHEVKTSQDGWIEVHLAPGTVSVSMHDYDPATRVVERAEAELVWPPAGGATELMLVPE